MPTKDVSTHGLRREAFAAAMDVTEEAEVAAVAGNAAAAVPKSALRLFRTTILLDPENYLQRLMS